jgi:hypothetical protein
MLPGPPDQCPFCFALWLPAVLFKVFDDRFKDPRRTMQERFL